MPGLAEAPPVGRPAVARSLFRDSIPLTTPLPIAVPADTASAIAFAEAPLIPAALPDARNRAAA